MSSAPPDTNVPTAPDELAQLRAERDALRAELDSERERFRVAFEHAPVGVSIISIATARYVAVNKAFADFIGLTPEAFLASDPYEIWVRHTHPDDFALDRDEFQRLVEGQIAGYQIVKRFIAVDGKEKHALIAVHGARDAANRLTYIIGHVVDLTARHESEEARRRLEDQLRHALKLEALGRLAGGIAHDFNNRLAVIQGHGELIADALDERSAHDAELGEHLGQILQSAARSADLTRQLLAFGRRQEMAPKSFDLNQTVDGMRKMLRHLLGDEVTLHTTLAAKGAAFADPGQIEQVILNLAVNARDAMPGGGRLLIATRDLAPHEAASAGLGALGRGEHVVLEVTDSGTGIAPEVLPHIFEPFYTTKDPGRGTGLGLATVESIVRQSGGVVQVESKPGQGSTFRVVLPAAAAEPERVIEQPSQAAAPAAPSAVILLVEDDDAVRRLLVDVLALGAYHVIVARDGQQALELARATHDPIDLVVSDLAMPRVGGAALVRALRQRSPALPALFLSGHTEPERLAEIEHLDHVAQMAKPFSPAAVLRKVSEMLAQAAAGRGAPSAGASRAP